MCWKSVVIFRSDRTSIHCLPIQLVAQCFSFLFQFPPSAAKLLPKSCRITCTPLVSIFWILKMGISFVTYDYKFNHLVIVSYFTVSFTCVTEASWRWCDSCFSIIMPFNTICGLLEEKTLKTQQWPDNSSEGYCSDPSPIFMCKLFWKLEFISCWL